jgi:GNAT superfamily N-acetyltransferase
VNGPAPHRIVEPDLEVVLAVRAEVLRRGTPSSDPRYPRDDEPGTVHLGIEVDGGVVGVSTWMPEAYGARPDAVAVRLRGMAVRDTHRGRGWGAILVAAGLARAAAVGASIAWAAARDTAVPFYEGIGWRIEGDGFLDEVTGLGHHHMWVAVPPITP